MSFLLRLWLATAFDSWRGLAYRRLGTVQASGDDIAFKEPAQIIAAAVEAQLHGAPVNGFFQLRRTAEGEAHVCAVRVFLYGHKVTIKSYLMKNSQERNPEIQGQDLGQWMKQLSSYPPLETRTVSETDSDDSPHRMSVSVSPEIKAFIIERAKQLGLSRSHYIRLLVNADIAKK
jgi:hypothetical protein